MRYHKIDNADMNNGEGLRVVLWLSGCPHKCPGCHNVQTWNNLSGMEFTDEVKQKLINLLSEDFIDGLTLSGGDPMDAHNMHSVISLVQEIKSILPDKTIWMWTGFKLEELPVDNLVDYIDCIIDGKYEKELPTNKKWRGSDNQKRYMSVDGTYEFID